MFGGFGMALMPVSMDLAVELTYPVPGGTSSGLMFILATFSCIGMRCVCVHTLCVCGR
jgi:hypothetical protein